MSDILHTFVALDLQTTGLKPVESEIIEIGAVRVINGQVTDRFQTYVHPDKGLPDDPRMFEKPPKSAPPSSNS